jgi:hypothetical protein
MTYNRQSNTNDNTTQTQTTSSLADSPLPIHSSSFAVSFQTLQSLTCTLSSTSPVPSYCWQSNESPVLVHVFCQCGKVKMFTSIIRNVIFYDLEKPGTELFETH